LKKDLLIAVAVIAIVFGIVFALHATRPAFTPRPSKPFVLEMTPNAPPDAKVIMRVNGVPVTEEEFTLAFRSQPEEMQRQFANPAGKQAFAEQYVRYKLLEQEADRLGLDRDKRVQAQLSVVRTEVLSQVALQSIVKRPSEQAIQDFYNQHKSEFVTAELSHIVIAYQGGMLPPRDGGHALTEQQAAQKAADLYQKIRQGADFAQVAAQNSDDPNSAPNGGVLGPLQRGVLPPELEAQVFRIPPGQVSGPIPSRMGIHLFRVGAATIQPLARVHDVVATQLRQQNATDRAEILRKTAKVDFDAKFFPEAKTWGKNPAS